MTEIIVYSKLIIMTPCTTPEFYKIRSVTSNLNTANKYHIFQYSSQDKCHFKTNLKQFEASKFRNMINE